MIDYLKLLLAILLPTFIGFVFISLLKPKNESFSDYEKIALSYLIGCGILSLEMLLLGAFKIKLVLPNILIGAAIILAAPLYLAIKNKALGLNIKSWFSADKLKWYEFSLLGLILLRVAFVLFENLIKPIITVDAFANWSLRAKVFFVESGLLLDKTNSLFFGGGHIFYPINIPLLETWIFNVLGYWNDQIIKIIFGLFFISLLILFYSAIKRFASRPIALLSTFLLSSLPLLLHHATIAYADLPVCVYFTGSALFMLNYFKSKDIKHLYVSALLAGLATWTKTEGTPLLIINLVVLCIFCFRSKNDIITSINMLANYFMIVLIFKLPWSLVNMAYQVPKNIYHRIQYENIFTNMYRLPVIMSHFYNKMFFYGNWNIAWFVFIIFLLYSFNRLKEFRRFYTLIFISLFLAAFSFMYYITENYRWLLDGTTLNRNILIIMPLVIYFIAINLNDFLGQQNK